MAGRPCTICTHPDRTAIEAAIVTGTSFRVISSQFSVGDGSVQRHATSHISQSVQSSQEAREAARGLDVVTQLEAINSVTLYILHDASEASKAIAKARDEKDDRYTMLTLAEQFKLMKDMHMLSLQAVDRVYKQLDLQMRLSLLTGESVEEEPEFVVSWVGGSIEVQEK